MKNKLLGALLLIVGILLVVAGLLLMQVIVPGMKQFPADVDTTRAYTGTMPVLLNAQTFEFMSDLDVDLVRHFMTVETDGDIALVKEEQQLKMGETVLQSLVKHYAIDRKTMEAVDEYPADWADTDGFWPREGLVLGWPIDSEEQDYTGWSDDYRTTVPLVFVEKQHHERADMDVLYFTASQPPQPIDPAHVAAIGLPTELPKEQFIGLIQNADVSDTLKNMLPAVVNQWEPATIPLAYYYEYEAQYWIEPQTGVLIDTVKHELRKVGLGDEFMQSSALLSNLPEDRREASRVAVFDLTYETPDSTVKEAAKDAQDSIDQIKLFGTTVPLILMVVGVVLALLGLFFAIRRTP